MAPFAWVIEHAVLVSKNGLESLLQLASARKMRHELDHEDRFLCCKPKIQDEMQRNSEQRRSRASKQVPRSSLIRIKWEKRG